VAEINLDSQAQVADALRNLGVPVPESTRNWVLEPLVHDFPVVAKLLEYRAAAKAVSSFGENILEFVNPQTGRLHSDFRQIGAPSGRFSSSRPNVQQIPHETEYRRCFTAGKGAKLVIADYSQIELRILADFSADGNFIKAFESGADFHRMTAAQVFGVESGEVTEDQRSFAKRLNFGVVYGIGASRFASLTGLTQKQAEDTLRRYFSTYRGLDSWLREAARRAVTDRLARTGSGRMYRFRFDESDRQSVAGAQRNGKNFPIQGTSADILKRALHLLHERMRGTSAMLVNIVHDEIIVECSVAESEATAAMLETVMLEAGREFVAHVPIKVDVRIADDWTK
jgi:DNA polymerase-1